MWPALFAATNAVALAGWAILIFAPRRPALLTAVLYLGIGLLCAIYAAMFVALVRSAPPGLPEYSIRGIRALFQSDGGIVLGWTHYLALDLFTGLWIAQDADHKSFGRLVQGAVLLLTFLAGPLGLLLWLIVRERRARKFNARR